MSEPQVTIVVTPRERFSYTERSLESIYENTTLPFKLVYVDANSPSHIKRYIEAQAKQKGFHLIRTKHFLTPNQARNLGLSSVDTKYTVFIDNDLLVTPGWLQKLVQCANETQAWVVGPLYLEGNPEDQRIHMVGGVAHFRQEQGRRRFYEKHIYRGRKLSKMKSELQRKPTETVEFHCALVRTEIFERLGPLDEKLMSLYEHMDLALTVREAGGTVYVEPDAIVTYVAPPPFASSDLPFYFLRWSDTWNQASLKHFCEKWNLAEEDPGITASYRWAKRHRRLASKSLWYHRMLPDKVLTDEVRIWIGDWREKLSNFSLRRN